MVYTDKKAGAIGAVCVMQAYEGGERELSFEEILLDETLAQGDLWVSADAWSDSGGMNHLLGAKKKYELLLRIAKKYRVVLVSVREQCVQTSGTDQGIYVSELEQSRDEYGPETEMYGWKIDCYIISRYKTELLATGCFDDAVKGVLLEGGGQAEAYLEGMLCRNEEYYRIYDYTQPILIYVGDEICYQVLDTFARNLGKALQEHGCRVIYFDMAKQPMEEIAAFVGKRLKAVIGMQTYLFSAKKKDGSFIHDAIGAAEYYFVFDHPVWLRHHLTNVPKQMTVLTPDGNYAAFIEKYYGHPARFLPPAGQEQYYGQQSRMYDISFLGTYRDSLLDELKELRKNDKKKAHFINRFILYMRRDIAGTPEHALEKLLDYYHMPYTKAEFEQQFFSVRWTILRLAHYYRRKVIETLLQAGLTVHVFGDSWKDCPLCAYEGLICHEQAVGEQALQVYGSSKLSLNIMTWHKDGFTERIANAMLQKSVVVTDCTTYLERNMINDKELILFRLDKVKELPQKITCLLEDDTLREEIAACGYQKAKAEHTWHKRAEQLLRIMDRNTIEKT